MLHSGHYNMRGLQVRTYVTAATFKSKCHFAEGQLGLNPASVLSGVQQPFCGENVVSKQRGGGTDAT